MNVKLVSLTQSMLEGEPMTAEQLIIYSARISNPANQMNHDTAPRLIAYLIKNKHWSPFEQAALCVEVKTSRAIAAQILRHWSLYPQEYSQRYAEVTDMEPVQIRKQGATNRQSSEEEFNPDLQIEGCGHCFSDALYQNRGENHFYCEECGEPQTEPYFIIDAEQAFDLSINFSTRVYKAAIKAEVAKECARMVLPLTTQTTMLLNGTIRDWIHYLTARTDPHAQLEHRQVAEAIKEIFVQQFPNISAALWQQNTIQ